MKYSRFFKFFLFFSIAFVMVPAASIAQIKDPALFQGQLEAGAVGAGLTTQEGAKNPIDPRILAGQIIKIILQLVGTGFIALIILAGYRLIKADGDTSKVEQAKETIQKAIVGLLIILASYSLASFAANQATKAINNAAPKTGFGSS